MHWQEAVEAKEGVEVTVETGHAARITVQDFFLRYEHLAGMTGTAASSARLFANVAAAKKRSQRRGAAREVWAVGLFAALTTVGAFMTLYLSGFDMLGQVGLFAALAALPAVVRARAKQD